MMKRRNNIALAGLLMTSLCCNSSTIYARNDGLVEGACAVGAAILTVAGVVALADWCCSETDDQMIARVDVEYRTIYSRYYDTMTYFGQISGMNHYVSATYKPFSTISESVLHEFATHIWNSNYTQYSYRSAVIAAKKQLKVSVQGLCKRVYALEGKCYKYEDQRRLATMRQLLNGTEDLLEHITLFADSLDHHRTYFNLYDTVDTIRNRYLQEITIFESDRHSVLVELKRYIVSHDSGQYALRTFVLKIESDIVNLKSDIRSLAYNYPAKRQYVNGLLQCLIDIKNIVMNDPRYQQELYEWEQARLQRLQLEILETQARVERARVYAMREQNRILEERNRILLRQGYEGQVERERLCNAAQDKMWRETWLPADVNVNVEIVI